MRTGSEVPGLSGAGPGEEGLLPSLGDGNRIGHRCRVILFNVFSVMARKCEGWADGVRVTG